MDAIKLELEVSDASAVLLSESPRFGAEARGLNCLSDSLWTKRLLGLISRVCAALDHRTWRMWSCSCDRKGEKTETETGLWLPEDEDRTRPDRVDNRVSQPER